MSDKKQLVSNAYTLVCAVLKRNPPVFSILAKGDVNTGGWSQPELRRTSGPLVDGVIELDFIAVPPAGPSTDVITPIEVKSEVEDLGNVRGISVRAQNNTLTTIFEEHGNPDLGPIRPLEERGLGPDPR